MRMGLTPILATGRGKNDENLQSKMEEIETNHFNF